MLMPCTCYIVFFVLDIIDEVVLVLDERVINIVLIKIVTCGYVSQGTHKQRNTH